MTCDFRVLVDRHFALTISEGEERRLREHLPTCQTCRERYERQLTLSQVLPDAATAQQRLGHGLGLRPETPRFVLRIALVAVPVAAALLFLLRPSPTVDDGFTPRGTDAGALAVLEAYRVQADGGAAAVQHAIAPNDALAFAYRNPRSRKYLLIAGVDSTGQVRWYAPSWTNPAQVPSAVAIEPGQQLRELPNAVEHSLPPGRLTIHAVFSDRAATVREFEAQLVDGGTPHGDDHVTLELEVVR